MKIENTRKERWPTYLRLFLLGALASNAVSAFEVEGVVRSEDSALPLPTIELHFGSDSYEYAHEAWEGHLPSRAIRTVRPDRHGRFELEIPGPGSWSIRTGGGAFLPLVLELRTWEIRPDAAPHGAAVALPPARLERVGSTFRVTVGDARGEPLRDAWIRSEPSAGRVVSGAGENPSSAPRGSDLFWRPAPQIQRSSESGTATFDRSEGQAMRLAVFSKGHAVVHSQVEPESRHMHLESTPGIARDVIVVDDGFHPIRGAVIQLHPGAYSVAVTDRDGRATLRSTRMDRALSVFTEESWASIELPRIDPGQEQPIVIQLTERLSRDEDGALAIRGNVFDTDGNPIPWAEIFCWKSVEAVSRDSKHRPRSDSMIQSRSRDDGSFLVEGLADPGPWTIEVFSAPAYLSAARRGVIAVTDARAAADGDGSTFHLKRGLRIRGRVLSDRGNPIPGAEIYLIDPAKRLAADEISGTATTDSSGLFAFEQPIPVVAGLRLFVFAYSFEAEEVRLADHGRGSEAIDVVLEPGHSIPGVVLDPDDQPVENAIVEVGALDSSLSFLPEQLTRLVTDSEGAFALSYLPEGTYEFVVNHRDFERKVVRRELGESTDEIEIGLEGKRGYPVVGWITSVDGQVARLRLSLRRADRLSTSGASIEAVTDGSGAFSFTDVPVGSYEIRIHDDPRGVAPGSRRTVVDGPTELRVELTSTAVLTGSIVGLDPARLHSLRIVESSSKKRGQIDIASESYRIEGLRPGPIRVVASVPSADPSSESLRVEKYAAIEQGQRDLVLDLDFGAGLRLSGVVRQSGEPFVHGRARLRGMGARRSTTTDHEGRFVLTGLVPGSYSLDLFAQGSAAGGKSRLAVSREIRLNSDRVLEIEVPSGVVVSGSIFDTNRSPIAGVELTILMDGSRQVADATLTDDLGFFEIADLPPGLWRLRARRQGYSTIVQEIEIGDESFAFELEMESAGTHTIRVRRPDGTVPATVHLALLGPSGRVFWSSTRAPNAEGFVHLDEAPTGDHWRLLVEADGGAFTALEPSFPIPPRLEEIRTETSGGVSLELRSLSGEPATKFEILDASGLPFRAHVPEYLRNGFQEIPFLPAGAWSLVVRSESGIRQHPFVIRPGQWSRVEVD